MPTNPEVDAALERARRIQRQHLSEYRLVVDRLLPPGYRTCWHCAAVILERETECVECGAHQPPALATALPTPRPPGVLITLIIAGLLIIACLGLALLLRALGLT